MKLPINYLMLKPAAKKVLISELICWFTEILSTNPQDIHDFCTGLLTSLSGPDLAFVKGWANHQAANLKRLSVWLPTVSSWSGLSQLGRATTAVSVYQVLRSLSPKEWAPLPFVE